MEPHDKYVLVDRDTLAGIILDSLRMQAHDDAGVDNWSGRDEIEWPTEDDALDFMDGIEVPLSALQA